MAPLTGVFFALATSLLSFFSWKYWPIALISAFLSIFTSIALYRLSWHPLAKFPGPFEAKISGSWRNRRFWRGTWHEDILHVHQTYGKVVRIGPNELSIVDERATKQLYGHGSAAVKTEWYATWDDPVMGPGLFATRNKSLHSFLRKRVSAVYSMSAMLRYEEYIQSCLDLMISRLKAHAEQKHTIDMADWTNALAFDVVGELAYGAPLGQLETESDNMGIRKLIHQGFFIMSNMGHYWGQSRWLTHPFVSWLRTSLGFTDFFSGFREWTAKRIVERQISEGKAEREDMLYHFLQMRRADGEPADFREIQMEAASIIGAGADTTSIAMRACLFYLCQSPSVYRDVQNEIDAYYAQNNLQLPITYQQTQTLPLFCAAVREAIRLFPSIVYPLLRHAPAGMEIDGQAIPVNTIVGISPIAANRNMEIWGDDANEFNPSRWLGSADNTRFLNSNDMTFGGHGARMCIGRNLALIELHKFVAQLLRNFDVEFEDPEKPWRVQSQWFANQNDMLMRIKVRGASSKSQSVGSETY